MCVCVCVSECDEVQHDRFTSTMSGYNEVRIKKKESSEICSDLPVLDDRKSFYCSVITRLVLW
jgi:hypothetical protein